MPDYPRVNPALYQRGPSVLGGTLATLGDLLLHADERKAAREQAKYEQEDRALKRQQLQRQQQKELTAEEQTKRVEGILSQHLSEDGTFDEEGAYKAIARQVSPTLAMQMKAEWAKLKPPSQNLMVVGPNSGVFDPATKKMLVEPTTPPDRTETAYDRFEEAYLADFAGKKGKPVDQLTPGEKSVAMLEAVKAYRPAANQGSTPSLGSFEDYVVRKYGENPTPAQIEAARKAYMQADDVDRSQGSMSPYAESNVMNRLVTQWITASKPAADLDRAVQIMDSGIAAARKGNLAQGAQAVLVTFQKILDPTSVVRESEYARSGQGQALMTRIEGAMEQLAKGGAGVPLSELEKFADLARQMSKAQGEYRAAIKDRIGRNADRYGIPRDLIFEDFNLPGIATPGAGGGAGPVRVIGKDGQPYDFPTQQAADAFKKAGG